MSTQILRGGTVIDGHSPPRQADVVMQAGRILAVVSPGQAHAAGGAVSDVSGLLVMPGLVDIQVHFREPGGTEAEDIATGAVGAARGGMTAVVMMPNTTPPLDTVDIVGDVLAIAARAPIDVHTAATLSVDRDGGRLVDFAALHALGVRIFTDDGDALADSDLMRRALQASTSLPGMVVSQHAEDAALVASGAINEGPVARQLGVGGRPREAEEVVVARDLALARLTGGRYHVLHISTSSALDHVRRARAQGVQVTCEVTPQHLVLTEGDVPRLRGDGKMNPPLRTAADVQSLRQGLVDGVIDAIATDHAPHPPARKALPLAEAPPGMLGTETAMAVVWTHLVAPGVLSPSQAVRLLSVQPAAIAGLHHHGGPVAADRPANICLFDPQARWVVDPAALASRSRNSPFAGATLTGRPVRTIVHGQTVHDLTGQG
ncbi:MAG TPA: dihydroorotase [Euzebya sp.]|nr:dihydroorotase [Euzebya sp.]